MTSGIRGIVLHKQAIRFVGVFAVFLLSLGAFAAGVDTSGVDDMSDLSILAWAYYAAGLFVFGGLDLGVPAGGSAIGRSALWTAYLLAPTITTTTVIEAALQLIRKDKLRPTALDEHVVVIGAGRLGLTYLQAIQRVDPEQPSGCRSIVLKRSSCFNCSMPLGWSSLAIMTC
jgi:hypothetical protein